ncbi:MAG TPA: HrgC protein [Spirochaetota bacterium]|nr:HrgC protein [Spirochaetota bacterium]
MINLKHSSTNHYKKVPTGFSWTTLFFGCFVPLFRGDVLWLLVSFLLSMFTGGLFWFVFPFIYNGIYIKNLLTKGFQPADDFSSNYLKTKGWIAPN